MHLGDEGRPWLSFVVIGVLLLVASSSTLLLPETLGQELPASLEDVRRLRRRRAGSLPRQRRGSTDTEDQQPLNNAPLRHSKVGVAGSKPVENEDIFFSFSDCNQPCPLLLAVDAGGLQGARMEVGHPPAGAG